ncbi:MAG: sulfatase-like hydrolase/transferase [Planctomycetota bacterium]|nr:sulfatase-like hydrolase/transferase [Planctomycetota bacterium]
MNPKNRGRVLFYYLCLTYVALLINSIGYLKSIKYVGAATVIFAAAVYISYCLLYLLIMFLPVHLLDRLLFIGAVENLLRKIGISSSAVLYVFSVAVFSFLQIFIFTDKFIYSMYNFHINGFIWNIVFTPGGLDSLGAENQTKLFFSLMAAGFILLQFILLAFSKFLANRQLSFASPFVRTTIIAAITIFILSGVFQALAYGISSFKGYVPVLAASKAFPMYQRVTFISRGLAKSLGLKPNKDASFKMKAGKSFALKYPLSPIISDPNHTRYNIIFLVAESLRGDMLTSEIMPVTWDFAQRSIRCTDHYSAGNGTRMGIFGMFYGLYGNYWFNFLDERKGPVLMDMLIEDSYQFSMHTSAAFTYPEFDKTIFSNIDPCDLHPFAGGQGWKSDRKNISNLIDFIENRDRSRPFMTFMFFESPHARYYFPPDTVIRPDYLKEFNYATVDYKKDIGLIKNRYINSCNHLDTQLARVINYLKDNNLLDSTIVIITGDHGEEFMEKGRWGHNSAFTEEQTIVPMVLWIPGCKPRTITSITSHLDIVPTLMKLLGVKNPPADYCLGYDLLGDKIRSFTVISDWNALVYVDDKFKAVFPLGVYGFGNQNVTTHNDAEVENTDAFYNSHRDVLLKILDQAGKFTD